MNTTATPAKGKLDLPAELTTPIARIDEKAATAFLRWLVGSPFQFHIDEDALERGFPYLVGFNLNERRDEAMLCLGYVRAWEIYNPCPGDEPAPPSLLDAAKAVLAHVAVLDEPACIGELRKAVAAEEGKND